MREYLGVYYGMVSMMDANIGRILDAGGPPACPPE